MTNIYTDYYKYLYTYPPIKRVYILSMDKCLQFIKLKTFIILNIYQLEVKHGLMLKCCILNFVKVQTNYQFVSSHFNNYIIIINTFQV